MPFIDEEPFELKAELGNAQGVMPGQGQTIRVAGMRVGDLGEVELEDGVAVVKLEFDPEYDDLVHARRDRAAAPAHRPEGHVPRARPGHQGRARCSRRARRSRWSTRPPDVNADEILSALDDDTRDYLRLLLTGAGRRPRTARRRPARGLPPARARSTATSRS